MDSIGALALSGTTTMDSNHKPVALVTVTTLIAVVGLSAFAFGQGPKKKAPAVTYKQVQAIFDAKCIMCHKGAHPPAKMNLESYAGVMKGNDDGAVIAAGHPEKSLLYQLITTTGKKLMPPKNPLPKADIAKISTWIKAGAKNK